MVPSDLLLVTIVTEALLATLDHLRGCQTFESLCRLLGGGLSWLTDQKQVFPELKGGVWAVAASVLLAGAPLQAL